ncbi:hypothetical protein [Pikeienuella sp. HZG-20]|uniref:hypothetical protein n=1 Tax=Paludibacillus litoralis TaxID=3133267 RepID=UPI0030ED6A69
MKTHCLYPSFSPVTVHVSRWNAHNSFRITDGGGAAEEILRQGFSHDVLAPSFKAATSKFMLEESGGALWVEVESREWIENGILAVANASALAASTAFAYSATKQAENFIPEIMEAILRVVPPQRIATEFSMRGASGKHRKFDLAVLGARPLLIKSVTPYAASVNANFVSFSDVSKDSQGDRPDVRGFCVFKKEIPREDRALLSEVAMLVPLGSVEAGARQEINLRS